MPLNGESKDEVGASPTQDLGEVDSARIGREEARGRLRSRVREVCAIDAIVRGDVVRSIGFRGLMELN